MSIIQVISQTATAKWSLSGYQGTTSCVPDTGSAPFSSFCLDNSGRSELDTARYIANGIICDGDEQACSIPSASATNQRSDPNFSIDIWFYQPVDYGDQAAYAIISKSFVEIPTTTTSKVRVKFDAVIEANQLQIYMKNNAANAASTTYAKFNLGNLAITAGWNHLTLVFNWSGAQQLVMGVYHQSDKTGLMSNITYSNNNQANVEDTNHQTCICGLYTDNASGANSNAANENNGLDHDSGIIVNEIKFYSLQTLTQAQAYTLVSTNCYPSDLCKICKPEGTAPYPCLQTKAGILQQYDFVPQVDQWESLVPDVNSTRGWDLRVDPADNFNHTPVFVDNQGMYFDKSFASPDENQYLISKGSTDWGNYPSFTLEAWVKPGYDALGSSADQSLYKKYDGSNTYLDWGFTGGTSMYLSIGGTKVTWDTQLLTTDLINKWQLMSVYVRKKDPGQSQICFYISGSTQECQIVNKVFDDVGTAKTKFGDGLIGTIKDFKVYDYPKVQHDVQRLYKTTCTQWDGVSCKYCPYDTGACISSCTFDEYGTDCTKCYGNCRSCWDYKPDTCYSCVNGTTPIWTYDYLVNYNCKSACGDSIKDDLEICDDGNTDTNDGCSDVCEIETGYDCFGGSFKNSDTCYAICQDGMVKNGEACDDGNSDNLDGCDQFCNIEDGWSCDTTSDPTTCTEICGDGLVVGSEECDDADTTSSGDGCSSTCTIEVGFNCTGGPYSGPFQDKSICTEICGDGKDLGKYGCDDGNNANYDGCNEFCEIETGWKCSGGTATKADKCVPECGDGRHMPGEDCDDGNQVAGDGCDSLCATEAGYTCSMGDPYQPDQCVEICGDGKHMGHLDCDDGNTDDWDGCHSDCTIELGWNCGGGDANRKDVCVEVCGDGFNIGGAYECDDGNVENGDGCSSKCMVESYWQCTPGDAYTASICSKLCNGFRDFEDMCDDGNLDDGDGCDSCCKRELGFTCIGGSDTSADACQETCGDGRKMNILPCDDGNTISGDGCSATCQIEQGFNCTGGTITTPDFCYEICGDGRNFGRYQCDDGNNENLDGCSYDCQVEAGFVCSGGNSKRKDTCRELCGDAKNMGKYECDDGNTKSGDGCSKTCMIEDGWECSQGNYYAPDICQEICGDGLNYGNLQCDDGNLIDGDGCSSYCSVEVGWVCYGGSKTSADQCQTVSAPTITQAYFTRDNRQIYLRFNESVFIMPQWNQSMWQFSMDGPLGKDNYQYSWNITRIEEYQSTLGSGTYDIIIDFTCMQQLFGNKLEKVRIDFVDRSYVRSTGMLIKMVNSTVRVYPYGQEDWSPEGQLSYCGMPLVLGTLAAVATYGALGFGFIGAFFGNSMSDTWLMMYSMQMIYIFPIMNLYMPSCLARFVKNVAPGFPQSDALSMTLFGGLTNQTYLNDANEPPGQNYIKMGFETSNIIRTCADVFSLAVYLFVLDVVFEIVRLTWEQSKIITKLFERFRSSVLNVFAQFAFIKLALASHLNLQNMVFADAQTSIGGILSAVVTAFCYIYTLYIGYQAFKFWREVRALRITEIVKAQQPKIQKFGFLRKPQEQPNTQPALSDEDIRYLSYYRGVILFEDFTLQQPSYPYSLVFPVLYLVKRLVIAVLVSTNKSDVQLIGCMIMAAVTMLTVMLLKPYSSLVLNLQSIFNEMGCFLMFMQAHMFIPRDMLKMDELVENATVQIFLLSAIVGLNATFVIYNKVSQLGRCTSLIQRKPDQAKINIEENPLTQHADYQHPVLQNPDLKEEIPTRPPPAKAATLGSSLFGQELTSTKKAADPVETADLDTKKASKKESKKEESKKTPTPAPEKPSLKNTTPKVDENATLKKNEALNKALQDTGVIVNRTGVVPRAAAPPNQSTAKKKVKYEDQKSEDYYDEEELSDSLERDVTYNSQDDEYDDEYDDSRNRSSQYAKSFTDRDDSYYDDEYSRRSRRRR